MSNDALERSVPPCIRTAEHPTTITAATAKKRFMSRASPIARCGSIAGLRWLGRRVLLAQRREDRRPLAIGLVLGLSGVLPLARCRGDRAVELLAAQQGIDVIAVERLVLEQRLGDLLELLAVPGQDLHRAAVLIGDDPADLGVDP